MIFERLLDRDGTDRQVPDTISGLQTEGVIGA